MGLTFKKPTWGPPPDPPGQGNAMGYVPLQSPPPGVKPPRVFGVPPKPEAAMSHYSIGLPAPIRQPRQLTREEQIAAHCRREAEREIDAMLAGKSYEFRPFAEPLSAEMERVKV